MTVQHITIQDNTFQYLPYVTRYADRTIRVVGGITAKKRILRNSKVHCRTILDNTKQHLSHELCGWVVGIVVGLIVSKKKVKNGKVQYT